MKETLAAEQAWLGELQARVCGAPRLATSGRVMEITGLTIVSQGPPATVGEVCLISRAREAGQLAAQVVGFRGGRVLLLPLARLTGVEPGCEVRATGRPLTVRVGQEALGRVLDAFGQPLDHKGPLQRTVSRPLEGPPPGPLQRQRVTEALPVGVRVIDGLLTCGKGQRIGVLSGAGLGKSTLLGRIARGSTADVTVIALVGERGREVRDFIETDLQEGLARSVVVVATSDEPALVRITAGLTATSIAEYFRDQGLDVLLIMDSVTRLARAQREVGLAAGETPTTRGYPPSVYEFLPRLLERAGCGARGTITGLYSVLVEGDDLHEPVADIVSSVLDGHLVLSRELAARGHYPAVEVNASVSRLMPQLVDEEHWQAALNVRALLAARQEAEDLLAVGAYRTGSRPLVDQALQRWDRLMAFLQQGQNEISTLAETRRALLELGAGCTGGSGEPGK